MYDAENDPDEAPWTVRAPARSSLRFRSNRKNDSVTWDIYDPGKQRPFYLRSELGASA